MQVFVSIGIVVVLIILATVKFKVHPVIALIGAGLFIGIANSIPLVTVLENMGVGFWKTIENIGLLIVFGTFIGIILEKTGGARIIADSVVHLVGQKRAGLAMNLTGFVVAIPVFCDSGFIILSSLRKRLSTKTGIASLVFSVALGTGLYAAHVFVPPTPGPLAAAEALGADLGMVLLYGLLVAVPVSLVGYGWARWMGLKTAAHVPPEKGTKTIAKPIETVKKIPTWMAFMPLAIPLLLIALNTIAVYPGNPMGTGLAFELFTLLGKPILALGIGGILALVLLSKGVSFKKHSQWLVLTLKQAGIIVLITGAGGAFGAVLKSLALEQYLNFDANAPLAGLLIAFAIAAILKTAQGSSTVAIITTAAIIAPLLTTMGLNEALGRTFSVLAIGAGAMTFSHMNDSYFWVVAKFSEMDVKTALRSHSMATLVQGVTAMLLVLGLYSMLG